MSNKLMKLLIVGSRTFNNYEMLEKECFKVIEPYINDNYEIIIVSGAAKGTDTLARIFAEKHHFTYKEFPADWDKFGKVAGAIRNNAMHKYISDTEERKCIAFWDGHSRGTAQNFSLAEKWNNPLQIIYV